MDRLPQLLNGCAVLECRQLVSGSDAYAVLVFRADNPHRYVVATWWPTLADTWSQGEYFEKLEPALAGLQRLCREAGR